MNKLQQPTRGLANQIPAGRCGLILELRSGFARSGVFVGRRKRYNRSHLVNTLTRPHPQPLGTSTKRVYSRKNMSIGEYINSKVIIFARKNVLKIS
jgi:hypothetical protein